MKQLFAVLLLLLATVSQAAAPTRVFFASAVTLDHPSYGFKYEVFNSGSSTIFIDSIRVSAGFDSQNYSGYQFALVPVVAPQTNCTSYAILNEDLTDPGQQTVNGSTNQSLGQVHALPCPHGYVDTTLGCNHSSCVGFDEFVLAPGNNTFFFDRSSNPVPIAPGKGLSLWGAAVVDPYTSAMAGIARVTFHFHQ